MLCKLWGEDPIIRENGKSYLVGEYLEFKRPKQSQSIPLFEEGEEFNI